MFERIRVEKRLRILEELVRILLAFVIALLIGIGATATKIYNYESRINELETMQQEGGRTVCNTRILRGLRNSAA